MQYDHHCYLHLPPPYPGAEPEEWHIDLIHSGIYFNCTRVTASGKRISRTLIIPPHIQATLANPKVAMVTGGELCSPPVTKSSLLTTNTT